jgi:hypothetical protein
MVYGPLIGLLCAVDQDIQSVIACAADSIGKDGQRSPRNIGDAGYLRMGRQR